MDLTTSLALSLLASLPFIRGLTAERPETGYPSFLAAVLQVGACSLTSFFQGMAMQLPVNRMDGQGAETGVANFGYLASVRF